jgi:hypothetical protein
MEAGLIPYTHVQKKLFFLLCLNGTTWSGFVGKVIPGEKPKETAIRVFHEKTGCIFQRFTRYIDNKLNFTHPIGETMWVVDFPKAFSVDISNHMLSWVTFEELIGDDICPAVKRLLSDVLEKWRETH